MNTKLPDWYWIVIVNKIMCRELCLKYWQHELFASRFGLFHLLLPWLQFSWLQSLWVLPFFSLKIWASALLSKRALFVSVENGRHLTPSLAKISAPPSFVHPAPFSCDSCSSREICLETAPLVKILSFVFCFFSPRAVFFCILHVDCQQRSWNG